MRLGKKSRKEHRNKGKRYFTFMLITDATKGPKSIHIPKWTCVPLLIVVALLLVKSASVFSYISSLEGEIAQTTSEVEEQKTENESKTDQIADLQQQLDDTEDSQEDQLKELKELASELGLKIDNLEEYKEQIEDYKKSINDSLGTSDETTSLNDQVEEEADDSVETQSYALMIDPDDDVSLSTAAPGTDDDESGATGDEIDTTTTEEIDFDAELDQISTFLDAALAQVDITSGEYETQNSEFEDLETFAESYPSIVPVDNTHINSYFGYRSNPFGGSSTEFHDGVDFYAHYVPVHATGAGTVIYAGYKSGYGTTVVIDHGYGLETLYGHLSAIYVEVGDTVTRGDTIAKSGDTGRSTGPHLHYGIYLNGVAQNPLDYITDDSELS